MNYSKKIEQLAFSLNDIKEKFDKIDKDSLIKEDLKELNKLEELLVFYMSTVLELAIDQNREFVKTNQDYVKKIIILIDDFIKKVNDGLEE